MRRRRSASRHLAGGPRRSPGRRVDAARTSETRAGGLWWAAALALALGACGQAPEEPGPAEAPVAAAPPVEAAPAPAADARGLLAWLDPDSPALSYARLTPDLAPEALGELFALPPRALALLRAPLDVEAGFDALLTGISPPVGTWLAPESLAMGPVLARGPYVVRRLTAPRADVEGWLRAAGMQVETVEGFAVWKPGPGATDTSATTASLPTSLAPASAFPWQVVFLADDTIGVFSLGEVGNGLGPLTAARDLPPSELSRTVRELIAGDPEAVLELYAQGSMLHFDLSDDVAVARLSLRRWKSGGLDGQVLLQPLGEPATAAAALEKRAPAGAATDVLRELYGRVAYTAEGPVVLGRLQLLKEDLAPLRRGGGA